MYFLYCEWGDTYIAVSVYPHLLIFLYIEVDVCWLLSPVVGSFIDVSEILRDHMVHCRFVLKHLRFPKFVLFLDLSDNRITSLNFEERVGFLIEFLHLSTPQ